MSSREKREELEIAMRRFNYYSKRVNEKPASLYWVICETFINTVRIITEPDGVAYPHHVATKLAEWLNADAITHHVHICQHSNFEEEVSA